MNWTLIKEKYPKAFIKFYSWAYKEVTPEFNKRGDLYFEDWQLESRSISIQEISFQDTCKSRRLYDFFDGEGIICEARYSLGYGYQAEILTLFDSGFADNRWHKHYYKTRTEAEEQAFLKAFEVLENKLK